MHRIDLEEIVKVKHVDIDGCLIPIHKFKDALRRALICSDSFYVGEASRNWLLKEGYAKPKKELSAWLVVSEERLQDLQKLYDELIVAMEGLSEPLEVIKYICPICGETSESKESIEECLSKGVGKLSPIGLIVNTSPDFYDNMTFAVARSEREKNDPHTVINSLWACRDNGVGDSTGKALCQGESNLMRLLSKGNIESPNKDHPTFKRIVEAIRKEGVTPTVWSGKEIVSLEEFGYEEK